MGQLDDFKHAGESLPVGFKNLVRQKIGLKGWETDQA
jgi:hypothetical protein